MGKFSKYVGLDVHKETIAVSAAEASALSGGDCQYAAYIGRRVESSFRLPSPHQ